jgi:hypothetical protein
MKDYRDILQGGGTVAELEEKKTDKYTWDNINTALTMMNMSPKIIVRVMSALKKVVKERLTVNRLDEVTTAGVGVGDYSPPLGVYHLGRKNMLQHCRSMGLSLGHLKDEDIRKTLQNMSVRNKRKFLGVADGNGDGTP